MTSYAMPELVRPVLFTAQHRQLQLLPIANAACQECPTPCRAPVVAPEDAVYGEVSLSSRVLNRLAMAFFGMPLLLLGVLIWVSQSLAGHALLPWMLLLGLLAACFIGGQLAKRTLPDVDRALKASAVIPNIDEHKDLYISR